MQGCLHNDNELLFMQWNYRYQIAIGFRLPRGGVFLSACTQLRRLAVMRQSSFDMQPRVFQLFLTPTCLALSAVSSEHEFILGSAAVGK